MDNRNFTSLFDQLNLLNISLNEIIDLTDLMLLGLENEKANNLEMAISGICIINKLIKDTDLMVEGAINSLEE